MGSTSSTGIIKKERKCGLKVLHSWSGRKHDGSDSWKSIQEMMNDKKMNSSKEFMLALVRKNGQMLSFANEQLKGDEEVVLTAVGKDGSALQYAHETLRSDREFVLAAVKLGHGKALDFVSEPLKTDAQILALASDLTPQERELFLHAVREWSGVAFQASDSWTCIWGMLSKKKVDSNKECMLALVQKNGSMLRHARDMLKADRQIALNAVSQNRDALDYVDKNAEFWSDSCFVLSLLEKSGSALQYASGALRSDREFVLAAVKLGRGAALDCVSEALKTDKKIVAACWEITPQERECFLTALRRWDGTNPDSNFHCKREMVDHTQIVNGDKECMLALVQKVGRDLDYANDELRGDKEVVLAAVSNAGTALEHASDELRDDKDVVLAAVSNAGTVLEHAGDELRGDKEVVLAAVSNAGTALEHASDELRGDKDVVLAAVSNVGTAFKHANDELRNDVELIITLNKLRRQRGC